MNILLRALGTAEPAWLQDSLEPVELWNRDVLAEPDEQPPYLYFPESGIICMVGLTSDGRSVELGLTGREGVAGAFGAFGNGRLPYRLVVQVPGRAHRVPLPVIRRRLQCHEGLGELLLQFYLPLLNIQLATAAICNRFHSGTQRLARWLLLMCDRTRRRTIPNSHDTIAEMVGGPRSAVSTAVASLRQGGLISSTRGTIRIVDRNGLEDTACECYTSITHAVRQYLAGLREGG